MPGLVRKLVIVAAVDGLIVQPAAQRNQSGTPGLRIPYASSGISAIDSTSRREDGSSTSIDAYGIVGTRFPGAYQSIRLICAPS